MSGLNLSIQFVLKVTEKDKLTPGEFRPDVRLPSPVVHEHEHVTFAVRAPDTVRPNLEIKVLDHAGDRVAFISLGDDAARSLVHEMNAALENQPQQASLF